MLEWGVLLLHIYAGRDVFPSRGHYCYYKLLNNMKKNNQ